MQPKMKTLINQLRLITQFPVIGLESPHIKFTSNDFARVFFFQFLSGISSSHQSLQPVKLERLVLFIKTKMSGSERNFENTFQDYDGRTSLQSPDGKVTRKTYFLCSLCVMQFVFSTLIQNQVMFEISLLHLYDGVQTMTVCTYLCRLLNHFFPD